MSVATRFLPAFNAPMVQLGLAAVVLALCLALPRAGSTVLLVPLGTSTAGALQLASAGGVALVGKGGIAGSLIVRAPRGLPLAHLLAGGVLPISVPAALCGETPFGGRSPAAISE